MIEDVDTIGSDLATEAPDQSAVISTASSTTAQENPWSAEAQPYADATVDTRNLGRRFFRADGSEVVGNFTNYFKESEGGSEVVQERLGTIAGQYVAGQRESRVLQRLRVPYGFDLVRERDREDFFYDPGGKLVARRNVREDHAGSLVNSAGRRSTQFTETVKSIDLYKYGEDGTITRTHVEPGQADESFNEGVYDPKTSFRDLYYAG